MLVIRIYCVGEIVKIRKTIGIVTDLLETIGILAKTENGGQVTEEIITKTLDKQEMQYLTLGEGDFEKVSKEIAAPSEPNKKLLDCEEFSNTVIFGSAGRGKTTKIINMTLELSEFFPQSDWYFCDGDPHGEYCQIADVLSGMPVAECSFPSNKTESIEKMISSVYDIYQKRKELKFNKGVSEVSQNRVFLVFDGFGHVSNLLSEKTILILSELIQSSEEFNVYIIASSQSANSESFRNNIHLGFSTWILHQMPDFNFAFLGLNESLERRLRAFESLHINRKRE
jgi:hypothetical protein